MIKDRRLGHFHLDLQFINDHPEMVRQMMVACTILRAEWRPDLEGIDYMAISEFFREVPRGQIAEHYTPRFATPDGFEGFD